MLSTLSLIKLLNNSCVLHSLFKELLGLWVFFAPSPFFLDLNGKKTSRFLELPWHYRLEYNLKTWKSLHQSCVYRNCCDNCFWVCNYYETLGLYVLL